MFEARRAGERTSSISRPGGRPPDSLPGRRPRLGQGGRQQLRRPAGQIAVMHRVLVEEKRWISEDRFLHALNYCMLLPGPEAQQLAIYIGWLLHRTLGGIVAGTLFVLPGVLGSIVTTWVTYVPCFLWIFLGAPYVESLRRHRALGTALAAITAAVVGVVLNLAVWFSLHTLFGRVEELRRWACASTCRTGRLSTSAPS